MEKKKGFFKRNGKYIVAATIAAAGLGTSIWGLTRSNKNIDKAINAFENSNIFAVHKQIAQEELASLRLTLDEYKIKAETDETLKPICSSLENTIKEKEAYYNSRDFVVDTLKNSQDTPYYFEYNSANSASSWSAVGGIMSIAAPGLASLCMAFYESSKESKKEREDAVASIKKSQEFMLQHPKELKQVIGEVIDAAAAETTQDNSQQE